MLLLDHFSLATKVSEYLTISIAVPPSPMYVIYWERSLDPWHPDAFKNITKLYKFMKRDKSKRKEGWMGIDYAGNPIGFVADGTIVEPYDFDWILKESFQGRLCAVRQDCLKIFKEHKSYIKK